MACSRDREYLFDMATEDQHISYARSRFVVVCGFLGLNKSDSAYLWSAFDMIDKHHNDTIHVKTFAATFCGRKQAHQDLLNLIFDKYSWNPPTRKFKAAVEHVDDDEDHDFDKLKEDMAKSEDERKEMEQKKEEERLLKLEQEVEKRLRPDYVRFLFFLTFFMSVPYEDMPRYVYWLFFEIPKVKPTQETLVACCDAVWDKKNHNKSWYMGEAKAVLKVVDAGFNAHTFQLSDQRTGGAWTIPFHEVRKQLTRNLGGAQIWKRVSAGFHYSMHHVDKQLLKMKDLRVRGAGPDPTSKGDRQDGRHDTREFVRHYRVYINMPKESEDDFAGTSCFKTVGNLMWVQIKQTFSCITDRFKSIAPEMEFDASMGLGPEGYVRPSSRGTLAKFKRQLREKGGLPGEEGDDNASVHSASTKGSTANIEGETEEEKAIRLAEEEEAEDVEAVVPLEYRFRRQLELPARVLNNKAKATRTQGKAVLKRVEMEVIPESEVTKLAVGNMPTYDTVLHSLDNSTLASSKGSNDEEDTIASMGSEDKLDFDM